MSDPVTAAILQSMQDRLSSIDAKRKEAQKPLAERLMAAMEGLSTVVDAMHGVRQQFIDLGWSEGAAEQMVLALIQSAVAASAAKVDGTV